MTVSTAEQAVVEPSRPAVRRHHLAWIWQITLLSLLLGAMLALALQTEFQLRSMGLPTSRFGARAGVVVTLKQSNDRLQEEVLALRKQNAKIEKELAEGSSASGALATELRDLKLRFGLLPVQGPGLELTLRDSPKKGPEEYDPNLMILHDSDINMILSELKAAGAEAIGIAGADSSQIQRVIFRTTARCTGPGMDVNDTRLGAPYRIFAVGNPKELRAQLEMRNGVLEKLGLQALSMITIQERQKITIPEYSGSFSFKYAKPADTAR